MSWQCTLLNIVGTVEVEYDPPKENRLCGEMLFVDSSGNRLRFGDLPIGTMFYVPPSIDLEQPDNLDWPWWYASKVKLSEYYFTHNSHRRPLLLKTPSNSGYGPIKGDMFCIDGACFRSENGDTLYYGGWSVTGDAPNITMYPSINLSGIYHGFLQNGVLSDDCEGRKY